MLGYSNTRTGRDECGSGRNVERAGPVAARSTCVKDRQDLVFPERLCFFAHDTRETNQFIRRFALHPKSRQKSGDLSIRCPPGHDFFHRTARFLFGEIDAFDHFLDEIGNHDCGTPQK